MTDDCSPVRASARVAAGDDIDFVVIGATNLARRVCASLHEGYRLLHLETPTDEELRAALKRDPRAVVVLLHDDVSALRYALAVAHLSSQTPLLVTIFDHTISDQVSRLIPSCHVMSPAALAAPSFTAACLDDSLTALHGEQTGAVALRRSEDGHLDRSAWEEQRKARRRARLGRLAGQLRPHDRGARLMLAGLLGMLAMLGADWAWILGSTDTSAIAALHDAARVVTTVGPANGLHGNGYLLFASLAMLATVVFGAAFTAGLVDRLLGPRLVGLVGPRTLPRAGHVLVVGLGQVGLRLCQELQRLGVPVVGVERDPAAPNLRIARALGLPVVTGHGGDRKLLERLRLEGARALAAVGSDDLDNVSVALAAQGVAPDVKVVLRAGEHEAIAETRSLLPLGTTLDVASLATAYVVAQLLGEEAQSVVGTDGLVHVEVEGRGFVAWPIAYEHCRHVQVALATTSLPASLGECETNRSGPRTDATW